MHTLHATARRRLRVTLGGATTLGALLIMPPSLSAQAATPADQVTQIEFESELPRTLVFITEEGGVGVATREATNFLREAGFPIVDPALAHSAAQRDLVRAAIGGDEGAAVELGRNFGAHVLVLGTADWGTNTGVAGQNLVTGTSEIALRALRLDDGEVLRAVRTDGRQLEATEQAARAGAIRNAMEQVLQTTEFVGAMANSWEERPWSGRGYFSPDPGSVQQGLSQPAGAGAAPRLAILRTEIAPPEQEGLASRGIGVVRRGTVDPSVTNRVVIEGVVAGPVEVVEIEGVRAQLSPVDATESALLGLPAGAQRFRGTTLLPLSRDTIRVLARAPGGATAEALAAPRIDERWAVVIGIGQYASDGIPDLQYAANDARSVREFLTSGAAGPFEDDHVLFLTDEEATVDAMRQAMFVFLQQADWDDLVVIYFAGHGAPDPNRPDNLYLLPHDADLDALAATAFPMWDVKTALRRQISAERVIVISDACHSGGTQEGLDNPINGTFADLFTPSRRLTLTAAANNELSFEDARWGGGHGVFTYHLLEGLRGAADANADGIVTFAEAADYTTRQVSEETATQQNPQRTGLGDVPLSIAGRP
ncbi:MAG TPA: caspase family protein [Longimicrobiales bacterium]|nr:caspase family protein [Longimicrobiales bacterium]